MDARGLSGRAEIAKTNGSLLFSQCYGLEMWRHWHFMPLRHAVAMEVTILRLTHKVTSDQLFEIMRGSWDKGQVFPCNSYGCYYDLLMKRRIEILTVMSLQPALFLVLMMHLIKLDAVRTVRKTLKDSILAQSATTKLRTEGFIFLLMPKYFSAQSYTDN